MTTDNSMNSQAFEVFIDQKCLVPQLWRLSRSGEYFTSA